MFGHDVTASVLATGYTVTLLQRRRTALTELKYDGVFNDGELKPKARETFNLFAQKTIS